jgi:NAD(P)-dependent dehydrogenase (short-subunit alcohol dehydrogenase family)
MGKLDNQEMGKLDYKVSVITGAASGSGAATAKLFAAEGATVIVADIDEANGGRLVQEIGASGASTGSTSAILENPAIAVSLSGVFYRMRFALPLMVAQGGGVIINTASVSQDSRRTKCSEPTMRQGRA